MRANNRPGRIIRRQTGATTSGESTDRHVALAPAKPPLPHSTDAVTESRAVAAGLDRFKAWWADTRATLPDDFEPGV
jgi:hypothetical protein